MSLNQDADEKGLKEIGSLRAVSRETQRRLQVYADLLRQWQKSINLVAPSTIDDLWRRHIADSIQTFLAQPEAQTWVDIGSGAGFPGLVTAILLADDEDAIGERRVDLIESVGKKCSFMRAVARETGLNESAVRVVVHQGRIEDTLESISQPDAVSARALAPLERLLELTKPFLGKGSVGVFAKGQEHEQEIEQASLKWQFDHTVCPSRFGANSVLLKVSNLKEKAEK